MDPQTPNQPKQPAQPAPPTEPTPAKTPKPSTPPPAPAAGSEPAKKGYGKRPMWQWVVLYLVIAAVVYFVVYLLFLKDNSAASGIGY